MMTNSRCFLPAVRFLLALLTFGGIALANTTIDAYQVDSTQGDYNVYLLEQGSPVKAYFAGVLDITLTTPDGTYNRETLCVDLFTDINVGQTYDTSVLEPSEVSGRDLGQVSWLIDNTLPPGGSTTFNSVLPNADWVTSADQGAGLQLAIWDLTVDGGDGFSSGQVQSSSVTGKATDPTVLGWAVTYESVLTQYTPNTSNDAFVYQNWDASGPAQMLEGPMYNDGGPTPGPEPATCLLTGAALVALGWFGRSRGRKSR
jgi:hypothetical protein